MLATIALKACGTGFSGDKDAHAEFQTFLEMFSDGDEEY
jgi:hypothetical protein